MTDQEICAYIDSMMGRIFGVYAYGYPPAIDQKHRRLAKKLKSGEINYTVTKKPGNYLAAAIKVDGIPTITLNYQRIWELDQHYSGLYWYPLEPARNTFYEELIIVLLHEVFHLENHNVPEYLGSGKRTSERRTESDRVRNESECWWYTVEELIIPMLAVDRLACRAEYGDINAAVHFYRLADGDPQHPKWQQLIKEHFISH